MVWTVPEPPFLAQKDAAGRTSQRVQFRLFEDVVRVEVTVDFGDSPFFLKFLAHTLLPPSPLKCASLRFASLGASEPT